MMQAFSKKNIHVLEAILYIALNHGMHPINGKQLAEKQGLPPRYLERVLQRCVHEGILRSIRGPRGGYVLARERRKITLAEVMKILSEEEYEEEKSSVNSALGKQILLPLCQEIENTLYKHLEHVTLAQLCDQAYAKRAMQPSPARKTGTGERQDFTI